MPQFACKFVTDEGAVIESIVDAESKFEIYETAESRNEMVLSVKKYKKPFDINEWFSRRKKIKPEELDNFTNQLSVMLKAGVPLIASLEAITEQTTTTNMREIIEDVVNKVNSGESLSQAMSEYPKAFNDLYVNMIKAGETAGVLDQILERLSGFIRHDIAVKRNIKAAMRYPIIVTVALVAAFIGASVFIIPKFMVMFESQGIDLPLPTRILMGISDAFLYYWWMIIIVASILVTGIILFGRTPRGAFFFDLVKLKFPIFKEIILKSTIARFAHMIDTLTKGGIQILRSLEVAEGTVGNLVIAKDIGKAKQDVEKGVALSKALAKSKWFPAMTVRMIAVGEQSGALDKMMENVAQQFDATVDEKIEKLSAAIEPLMTVAIGGFLMIFALGIFLPMFSMYGNIK